MAHNQKVFKIFLSSPQDVRAERKIVKNEIEIYNKSWSEFLGIAFKLISWEDNVRPSFGEDIQEVINHQVKDDFDIFLGVMWRRFGTPTLRAKSGSEEEFESAYSLLKDRRIFDILYYFKDLGGVNLSDCSQLQEVTDFKQRFQALGGFYKTFENTDSFRGMVTIDINSLAQKLYSLMNKDICFLGAFSSESENDFSDYGLIELEEKVLEASTGVSDSILAITKEVELLGNYAGKLAENINRQVDVGRLFTKNEQKKFANDYSKKMLVFVESVKPRIVRLHNYHFPLLKSFHEYIVMYRSEFGLKKRELEKVLNSMIFYADNLDGAHATTARMRGKIDRTPPLTSKLKKAKKLVLENFDRLSFVYGQSRDSVLATHLKLKKLLD